MFRDIGLAPTLLGLLAAIDRERDGSPRAYSSDSKERDGEGGKGGEGGERGDGVRSLGGRASSVSISKWAPADLDELWNSEQRASLILAQVNFILEITSNSHCGCRNLCTIEYGNSSPSY